MSEFAREPGVSGRDADIFVSYSSQDAQRAFEIVAACEAAGFSCWIAPRDPIPGIPYSTQIVGALDRSRVALLLLSDHSNASDAVLGEIEIAANRKRPIVPVRIADVQPSPGLEYYIRATHWYDALEPHSASALGPLLAALPAILAQGNSLRSQRSAALAAPAAPRTNLPIVAGEVLGREAELARAADLLSEAKLLTIVATGGIGKTRLAIRLASDVAASFPDGVWFVDLAAIEGGELVAPSIARVAGVTERTGAGVLDDLAAAFEKQRVLLVLDNCEHVVTGVARVVAAIASRASDARFIATSREPIAVASERQLRLGPLALPDATAKPNEIAASPAVRLFIERARAIDERFDCGPAELPTIATICSRLDGIPLAIELAAARTGLFDAAALAAKMDDLLRLLAQKRRDVAPRQQTLEAMVDWSYRLLDENERDAFERLGVFAGAFSLEAALAVAAFGSIDEFDLETHVESLIEKSFVVVEHADDARRLRMYETIRQFAQRRLGKNPVAADLARRHARWFAGLAERTTRAGAEELGVFGGSLADIRAAFRATLDSDDGPTAGVALALGLARYGLQSGQLREGRAALDDIERVPSVSAESRAWIAYVRGELAQFAGQTGDAERAYLAAAAAPAVAARANVGLARVALARRDPERARGAIDLALATGGDAYAAFTASTMLVNIALGANDRPAAREHARRAYDEARSLGDRARSFGAGNLAALAFADGDLSTAARLIDEAVTAAERSKSRLSHAYYACIRAEVALFGERGDPEPDARTALAFALESEAAGLAIRCAETLAASAARRGASEDAARLLAYADLQRERSAELHEDDDDRALSERKRLMARSADEADVVASGMERDEVERFVRCYAV